MKKLQLSSCLNVATGILCSTIISHPAIAQITPDPTLAEESSQVNSISAQEQLIEGGALRDSNLFHSFSEFNVGANQTVNFANPDNIVNIFSRVTGNNISQILGDLGVLGNANLFLINPNGIIFGENASLNVNGSFVGTTANSVNFTDGNKFVANPASGKPLLTINQPTALEFGNQPGTIINRAQSPQKAFANGQFNNSGSPAGLLVTSGKTLALIGGEVVFEGGNLTATGGNIEVGSVGANSVVSLSVTESQITFDYQGVNNFSDISLTNRDGFEISLTFDENGEIVFDENGQAVVNFVESTVASFLDSFTSETSGSINIQGRNIDILNGSQLQTFTLVDLPGGDININATEQLTVSGFNLFQGMFPVSSGVGSLTIGKGNAGNINITTPKLVVENTAGIASDATETFNPLAGELVLSEGNAGNISINAESIGLSGQSLISSATQGAGQGGEIKITATDLALDSDSLITTETTRTGDAGNIAITTEKLTIQERSSISTAATEVVNPLTQELIPSEGNAGSIQIDAAESVALTTQGKIDSGTSGTGDGGIITITSPQVNLDRESLITTSTFLAGNAGTIEISTNDSLTLDNSSEISSTAEENVAGNAGTIKITSDNLISLDNNSVITSSLAENALGNAGEIELQGFDIDLNNKGRIATDTAGQGNAGLIKITADNALSLDNASILISEVFQTGIGDAGSIEITAPKISFDNGSQAIATTKGQGNAGAIDIIAADSLSLDNASSLLALLEPGAVGQAGTIDISAPRISFDNNSQAIANTQGKGDGGAINIIDNNFLSLDRNSQLLTKVNENAEGRAGNINIETNFLALNNYSGLISDSEGKGNGGNINLEIGEQLLLDNNSLIRSGIEATGIGDAGNIRVNSPQVILDNRSGFSLGSSGPGKAGDFNLAADELSMNNSSFISSSTKQSATAAGMIAIDSSFIAIANESGINGFTTNNANGGAITISASNLELKHGGAIFADTEGAGNAGNIRLNVTENILIDGSASSESVSQEPPLDPSLLKVFGNTGLFANTDSQSTGNGGNITIGVWQQNGNGLVLDTNQYTDRITVLNDGSISANSLGAGSGGSIALQSREINLDNGQISATTTSLQEGNNLSLSNINLSVGENLTLRNNSQISTEAGNNADGGNININADFVITSPEDNSDIRANADLGQGGNIIIDASGVFGIQFQTEITDFSDLIVSSQLGIDGTFQLINSERQLDTAESESNLQFVENVANFTPNYCYISRTNQYIVTGRGGLPLASQATSVSEHTWEDWRILSDEESLTTTASTTPAKAEPEINHNEIKTIQGWKVNERGKIVLTAEPIVVTPHSQPDQTPGC